jgi:hypothetical protein
MRRLIMDRLDTVFIVAGIACLACAFVQIMR